MQTLFCQQLEQHLPTQTDFLISLSGGVDSVVLLHLFCQLRQAKSLNLRAVHIHHGLSENADAWAQFCQGLCTQWQVPLVVQKVQVAGKKGLEANAREARYQAISQHIQSNEVLATAHHLDDQAETFFLALKRGAGVKGLAAIQAVGSRENFAIFRPLLPFSKAEILAYAEAENLRWIVDESNHDNAFDRNFLRNAILPQLNQRWAQFSHMVARSSQLCREQQQLLDELLSAELNGRIDLAKQSLTFAGFAHFSTPKQQALIRLWLEKCGEPMPSQAQLTQIIARLIFAKPDSNPQVKLGEKVVRRYQQRIYLIEPLKHFRPVEYKLPALLCTAPVPLFSKEGLGEIWQKKKPLIRKIDIAIKSPPAPLCLKRGADRANFVITLPNQLGTILRTADSLICKKLHGTDRLLLPTALQNQPLTIKLNAPSKVKCYGKPQREEMKKIWQQHNVPVWERGRTPLVFFEEALVGLL